MLWILESLYDYAEWYTVFFSFLAIPTAAFSGFYFLVHRYSLIRIELPAFKLSLKKKKKDGET